jgi:hypothetical protein
MHKRFNILKSSLKHMAQETDRLSEDLRTAELDKVLLNERIEQLRIYEQKQKMFEKREPEIKHYLEQYSILAKYVLTP